MVRPSETSLRRTLLGSVAAVGLIAFGAAGAVGYHYALPSLTAPAHAADATQSATQPDRGFADLVEKVKPAVISVRVKMEDKSGPTAMNDRGGNNVVPSLPDSRMRASSSALTAMR